MDALSNSTLSWFNWASVPIHYLILVSSISLQLYHVCSLGSPFTSGQSWGLLCPSSMSYFCFHLLLLTQLCTIRSRWLNFYPSFMAAFFLLLFAVLLTTVIASVWQSEMSLSRISPFLCGAGSCLSCRILHVYTRNVFLSAG